MQHCSIISLTQIDTDDRCVKKHAFLLKPKTVCLIVDNNESCLNYMVPVKCRWVTGQSASTHDPYDHPKPEPYDPLTHDPSTHCLLWLQPKTTFHNMATVRHLELKILSFGQRS